MKITYKKIDFEVTGTYVPKVQGKDYLNNGDPGYPSEGAYLDEMDILHEGESVYEVLSEKAVSEIERLALAEMEQAEIAA